VPPFWVDVVWAFDRNSGPQVGPLGALALADLLAVAVFVGAWPDVIEGFSTLKVFT
jgi:hypothetical protein